MDVFDICQKKLVDLNLDKDVRYQKRLKWEKEEIIAKNKVGYFADLYQKGLKVAYNENNLIVCWLLGIAPDYSIEKEPNSRFDGDLPDVDVDYIADIRDILKNVWAPQTFGEDYVCNISNYTTFGLKSALIDMARVHDLSRDEVLALTKNVDNKDEDGNAMTWDAAMKQYPELNKYCEEHPDVAVAAKKLLNRNRGMGLHAGGLIISKMPIHDLVPLVKRKDSPQASAWVEGLHGQDLQPVGLIKFDLLVISNLLQIARCCELIKKRHGIDGICNRPGGSDWTDVAKWRNDPDSLKMANSGDLKCIFQFDSEGIRNLVRAGGVDRFEDLVVYASLFRPGPLNCRMHERYIERKRGREKFDLHPLIRPILEKTYGVMVFQEQIMQILNVVGEIPLRDCEIVRKAISKKKIDMIAKYKEMFLCNGRKNLGCTDKEINDFYNQVESFSEYGFNKSHAVSYTYISMRLLYLKAHYRHEFYNSILSCETLSDKIKEYKMEAKIHGVGIKSLDVNKASDNFELIGDDIYFGFSKIKGIGEEVAKKIVASQPYSSFEEFLYKFGTEANVLKPLLGLRCFKDADPVTLWKFSEHYKNCFKKIESSHARYHASLERYEQEFKELALTESCTLADLESDVENPFDSEEWKSKYDIDQEIDASKNVVCSKDDEGAIERIEIEEIEVEDTGLYVQQETIVFYRSKNVKKTWNAWKELRKLWQKRKKTIKKYQNFDRSILPKFSEFNPHEYDIDPKLVKEFSDPVGCEEKYYGFAWIHELELSPDYHGNLTFDALNSDLSGSTSPVEIKIKDGKRCESKKGNAYWKIVAEDVTGQQATINIWPDDWEWWSKEFGWDEKTNKFVPGNLLRVRLQPPSGGFKTFLLESNQAGKWRGQKKYRHKHEDIRVYVLAPGKKQKEKALSDDEVLEYFSNCVME
jgi:hypothetical protein